METKRFKDKRMNIMVNKMSLPEEVAEWCLSKSKKYCLWIANQIVDINCYRLNWFLQTQTESQKQKFNNFSNEVDSILDWKKEVQNINLNEYRFNKALKEATKFQKSLFVPNENGLKNTSVVLDCGEFKWVQLSTSKDCKEEGSTMGHCIGNSSHSQRISSGVSVAFSLRDKYNRPHLTVEAYSKDKRIFEFKGHSNSAPKPEYLDYFVELNKKYNFSEITDSTKRAFENNVNAVREISNANSNFFTFDFQLSLGLSPFGSGESYLEQINIISAQNITIPDNVKLYSSFSIATSGVVVLGDNVLIGGDLILNVNKRNLTIGENIGVGGNLLVTKELINTKKVNNLNCFGKTILI